MNMFSSRFSWRSYEYVFRPEVEPGDVFLQRVAPALPSPYVEWVARWTEALAACHRDGGQVEPLRMGPRAKEKRIARREKKAKMKIPAPLRAFFLNMAEYVSFSWENPGWTLDVNGYQIKGPAGHLHIRLKDVIPVTRLDGWNPAMWSRAVVDALGEDAEEVRAFLENAIAFMAVGNGDQLVIDARDGKVKYLSHDDPEIMGVVLGQDFDSFMDAWSSLGCIGPEIWHLQPFLGANGLTKRLLDVFQTASIYRE